MFEQAARLKLRFDHRGIYTVEDLWDLPLATLDDIYLKLWRRRVTSAEISLLVTRGADDEIIDLQIGIVKHVVAVRLAEQSERQNKVKVALLDADRRIA